MRKICLDCGELKDNHAGGLCMPCYQKKWYIENFERIAAKQKKYRLKHPEIRRKHYLKNKEKIKAYQKKYRLKKKEKLKAIRDLNKPAKPEGG